MLTLQITILWSSVFSLVCAFVQNFEQLLVARALLGLGFDGEWAAGAVLMGETIRVGALSQGVGLASAIAIFAAGAYEVFFLAAFALPETRGKVLHADG